MPDEWAKALRPTMALLGCTGTRIKTGYQLAGSDDLPGVDTDIEIQIFVTGNRHHDFFEGGVTGPFAEAVDRHFDLPCSVLYGG